jgi:hypothetical protein
MSVSLPVWRQVYAPHGSGAIALTPGRSARAGRLEQVTFLRMGDLMFDNWDAFSRFLQRMRNQLQ